MRLALGMTWKFYISVAKGLKIKFWGAKVLGATSYVCRSNRGKSGRERPFLPTPTPPSPSWIGLKLMYIFEFYMIIPKHTDGITSFWQATSVCDVGIATDKKHKFFMKKWMI